MINDDYSEMTTWAITLHLVVQNYWLFFYGHAKKMYEYVNISLKTQWELSFAVFFKDYYYMLYIKSDVYKGDHF